LAICQALGYSSVSAIGGTCGNVCGYCQAPTSCSARGNEHYDGGGAPSVAAVNAGATLSFTVHWRCANASPALNVAPPTDLTASGPVGGPFTSSPANYIVQNTGSGTLNWSVTGPAWLTFSPSSGSLAASSSQGVSVSVNANANAFAAGTQTGTISFGGNGGSATRTATLTVNQGATTTAITSDVPDPSVFGESYTVTASVTPAGTPAVAPSGMVLISDGTNNCAGPLSGGIASCAIPGGTPPGNLTLTATYVGDANFLTSSGTASHAINKGATTVAITSDTPDPSALGQAYSVTASVSAVAPAIGTPSGTITFTDGTSTCTSGALVGGSASCSLAGGAPPGNATITATYNGDANFLTSSGTASHTIDKGATTVAITSDAPDPSVFGQAYTVTASVSVVAPAIGTPSGTITFTDGTSTCTSGALVSGSASCSLAGGAPPGNATITATYNGDANFLTSSGTTGHVITKGGTTVSITSDVPDPSSFGQPYTVTASVAAAAPAAGTPTGTITITDGTGTCTTGALSGGAASCVIPGGTPVGSVTVTATYNGDANFQTSTATTGHVVDKGATTTVVISDTPDPSMFGQSYTVSVSVSPAGGAAGVPTGTVSISDGTNTCTTGALSGGTASCIISSTPIGTNTPVGTATLTATYAGDANFTGSSGTASHTVGPGSTTTTITSDTPDPSVFGQPYTVAVYVAPAGGAAGAPTGTVTISDGSNSCTTGPLAGNAASCVLNNTPVGTATLTATYGGDASFTASSGTASHVVNKGATTTAITSDTPDPSVFGQPYTVAVSVVPSGGAAGTPSGTVSISDGTNACTTGALSGGTASCVLSSTPVGTATLTATYAGDTSFAGSSATATHVVNQGSSTTTITADTPDPSAFGQPYTVTVSVAAAGGAAGTPTGIVSITDGTNTCTTAALSGGTGSCMLNSTAIGTATLTATYAGDGSFTGSSGTATHVVNQGATSTTITADTPDPSVFGQPYTVTVSVVPAGGATGTPTGVVSISDGSSSCTTGALSGGTASCVLSSTPVGNATLTATYAGDASFATSSDTEPHAVQQIPTTVGVTSSVNPSFQGQAVTFTATIAPSTGTGTVTFKDGATTIGTAGIAGGTAAITTSALAAGSHSITAVYSGDGNHAGATSATLAHNVTPNGTVVLAVVTSEGDGTFSFSSPTPSLVQSVTTSGGSGQTPQIPLNPGVHSVTVALPDGFGLTGVSCSDADSSGSVSGKSATIVLAPAELVTCTFSSINSRKKTVEVIHRFMSRRNDLLLSSGPDPNRQIDRLMEAAGNRGGQQGGSGFVSPQGSGFAPSRLGSDTAGGIGSPLGLRPGAGSTANPMPGIGFGPTGAGFGNSSDGTRAGGFGSDYQQQMMERPGLSPFKFSGDSEGSTRMSFAASLSQYMRYNAEAEDRKIEEARSGLGLGAGRLPAAKRTFSPLDIWAEGQFRSFTDDRRGSDSDGHFGVLYVGADYVLNPALLVGVLAQFDSMELRSSASAYAIKGEGWMAGPYATARLTSNVFLQARAAAGGSSNSVQPFLTYSDNFKTSRWLASATLVGRWTFGDWQFRPSASLAYIEDNSQAYVDSLGVNIPGIRVSLGQAKVGPELSYTVMLADGTLLTPHFSAEAIWNFGGGGDASVDFGGTLTGPQEWRGRVEAGVRARLPGGIGLDLSGSYDGIGAKSYEALGGRATVRVPLN